MPARHALDAVIDLVDVASTDVPREHDGAVAIAERRAADVGLADGEKVRAQAADEPLDEDL